MEQEIMDYVLPNLNPYQQISEQAAIDLDQDLEDAVNQANQPDYANSQIYHLNEILDAIGA